VEGKKGKRGEKFEEGNLRRIGHGLDLRDQGQQHVIGNRLAVHDDAFGKTHQMRRGKAMHALACRFKRRLQKSDGGTFAVRARNVKNRRQGEMRMAKTREQHPETVQPLRQMRRIGGADALQRFLDRGMRGIVPVGRCHTRRRYGVLVQHPDPPDKNLRPRGQKKKEIRRPLRLPFRGRHGRWLWRACSSARGRRFCHPLSSTGG